MLNLPDNSYIAKVQDVLEDEIAYYVVMQRSQGMDLQCYEHGSDSRGLTLDDIKIVIAQTLHALKHLHSHGLVHKDVKLENIVLHNMLEDLPMPPYFGSRGQEPLAQKSDDLACVNSPISIQLVDFDTVDTMDASPSQRGSGIAG